LPYRQMTKPTCLLVRNAAILVQRIVHRAGRDTSATALAIHHHRDVLSMDVAIITRDEEEDDDECASKCPPRRRNSMTEHHRAPSTTQ
jgi:hypothetical protein